MANEILKSASGLVGEIESSISSLSSAISKKAKLDDGDANEKAKETDGKSKKGSKESSVDLVKKNEESLKELKRKHKEELGTRRFDAELNVVKEEATPSQYRIYKNLRKEGMDAQTAMQAAQINLDNARLERMARIRRMRLRTFQKNERGGM